MTETNTKVCGKEMYFEYFGFGSKTFFFEKKYRSIVEIQQGSEVCRVEC